MKEKKGSILFIIFIIIIAIILASGVIFLFIFMSSEVESYNLNFIVSSPFESQSAKIEGERIIVEIKNAGEETVKLNEMHLTFNSPTNARCERELALPMTIEPGTSFPIILEKCMGLDLKKESIDAKVSISYQEIESGELRTSTGTLFAGILTEE